jgi:hypothetical protein
MSRLRHALMLGVLVCLAAVAPALGAGVTPKTVEVTLQAGASTDVAKAVQTTKLPPKSDFVFLADNTGSMGAQINDVKANSQAIIDAIEGAGATDARYGVANYQDFTSSGPCPYGFELDTDLTTSTAAKAAINTWVADNGCDTPEADLYALHRVAVHDISWRPGSARFVIWFGDAPGHDPVCAAINGEGHDVTELSAIADLQSQGVHVIAASVEGPNHPGLNADPKTLEPPDDYAAACGPEQGIAGQGVTIATATGGVFLVNPSASSVSDTIIAAINALPPIPVTVTPVYTCEDAVTLTFTPPSQVVNSGDTANFTETIHAGTTPGTFHCTVDFLINGSSAGPDFQEAVTVHVVPANPATLTLSPKTAVNTVDAQHCVTATVKDAFGNATPGITVRFSVSGSVSTSGSQSTDTAGQATFCYTGPALPGADVITAFADTNTNGTQDAGEPSDTATKQWVLPTSTAGCKVTYGGRITAANGDKATFGGNAQVPASGPKGQEEYQDHGAAANLNVHSLTVDAVVCSRDGTSASIFGTATVNGGGTFDYRIDLKDLGEPGTNDRYRIRLSNGYDSGDQQLSSGNVQIH